MDLKVLLPTEVLINESVIKVVADAVNGSFCLLPRHIDFVTALVPGILSFYTTDGVESFAAVDHGILVKVGDQVLVSTINAVRGTDLDRLQATITERFLVLDEQERVARTALARLEAGTIRRFIQFEEQGHG
ncbi:MAG: F0F1 ATP synthase subunit epsilon [Proteobacteria bacterium]|nr:MAG: F0F1 ATP synthase subunit epsilon [Pseudomonadota bacterium]